MGLSALCFFSTTQAKEDAIDSSVLIVNEEDKMAIESAELSAELLCHSRLLNQH